MSELSACNVCLIASVLDLSEGLFLICVFALGYSNILTSGHRPSVRPFVCDLVSAAKLFVRLGDIRLK